MKTSAAGAALLAAASSIYGEFSWQTLSILVSVLVLVSVIAFTRSTIMLASDTMPNKPTVESEPIPDGPPPLHTHFRGSSGPPPRQDAD